MNMPVSSLTTITTGGLLRNLRGKDKLALVCFAFVFAIAAACGPSSQMPPAPVITFSSPKQIRHQREAVTAHVEPPLAQKEFLQLWVRAGDNQWYPCDTAKQHPSSGAWNAVCQFGSDKHPAAEGSGFVLGAFYTTNRVNSEYLPDSVWYLLKTQQTQPVVFTAGK